MKEESWLWSMLNLAWTVGPVTFLGLYGGYYLGYGKTPAPEIFIYFAGYTLIAGILAVAAQFARSLVLTPRIEQAQWQLLQAVERLFMLYFSARNEYLTSYPPEEQPMIAAWWSCRSAATDFDALEEAIRDVTGDDALAQAIKRIEFYRKQGFTHLMRKEHRKYEDKVREFSAALSPRFPGLTKFVTRRFAGEAPTIRDGQPRPAGFIERLMAAEENARPELATPDDVLALILLTLELLLGRKIIALYPEFNGHKKLEEAKKTLDALLSDFQLLRRRRNGRMHALILDLTGDTAEAVLPAAGASGSDLRTLLLGVLRDASSNQLGRRRYDEILRLNDRLSRLWRRLVQQEQIYNRLWQKDGATLRERLSEAESPGRRRSALTIAEHEITLTHRQKIKLAQAVHTALDDITIRQSSLTGMIETERGQTPLGMDDYKKLAFTLLNLLDELLNISEPEEQLAVEASQEADFGCIEPGLAAQTKLNWGRIVVEELQQDRIQIAHRLAASLVRYLNVPLGEATIDYLVREYGASQEFLEKLQSEEGDVIHMASAALETEILTFPRWPELKK